MALPTSSSLLFAATLGVLTFAAMQTFKTQLASTELMTIFGGFLGAQLFVFCLTAMGNFETTVFGRGSQVAFIPEVFICLLLAMFASGLIHRVCVTTCFIFSCIALYYLNKISAKKYAPPPKPVTVEKKGKKHQ